MRIIGILFFILIAITGIAFAVLNADPVTLNYYLGAAETPLSLALVGALGLGALLGVIASTGVILRMKRELSKLRRERKNTEKEIMNLRNIPIKGSH
ncbi:MAG: LapA family protein [Gammaproteobacteria bacterium]|nr:LapA family protein [Gammaproteobacteria bacterium]